MMEITCDVCGVETPNGYVNHTNAHGWKYTSCYCCKQHYNHATGEYEYDDVPREAPWQPEYVIEEEVDVLLPNLR